MPKLFLEASMIYSMGRENSWAMFFSSKNLCNIKSKHLKKYLTLIGECFQKNVKTLDK
jgi:hypothetical protein